MSDAILIELFPCKRAICSSKEYQNIYFEYAKEDDNKSTWIFVKYIGRITVNPNDITNKIVVTIEKQKPFNILTIINNTDFNISFHFFDNGYRIENIEGESQIKKYLRDIKQEDLYGIGYYPILDIMFDNYSKPLFTSYNGI